VGVNEKGFDDILGQYQIRFFAGEEPNRPNNLAATILSNTQVELNFDEVYNAASYVVERTTLASQPHYTEVGVLVTSDDTRFLDKDLVPGETYIYHIKSVNLLGASNYSTIAVTLPLDPPDLTVYNGNTSDIAITASYGMYVSFTVKNIGADKAGASDAYAFLSNDAVLDHKDVLLATNKRIFGLNAGQSMNTAMNLTLPSQVQAGSQYIIIKVDGSNAIQESNEANNYIAIPFTVTIADLTPLSFTIDKDTIRATNYFGSVLNIRNDGDAAILSPYNIEVWLSPTTELDTDQSIRLYSVSGVNLMASQNRVKNLNNLHIPIEVSSGNYYLTVTLDWDNVIPKRMEYVNNSLSVPIYVINPNEVPPVQVTGVKAQTASSSAIVISFDKVPYSDGYAIFRSEDGIQYDSVTVAYASNFTDAGLTPQKRYYYKVRGFNAQGLGAFSSAVSATTYPATNIRENALMVAAGYALEVSSYINGNVENAGSIENEGQIVFYENWSHTSTGETIGQGEVVMLGNHPQTINGKFSRLKTAGVLGLVLDGDLIISELLSLENSGIQLGDYNLTILPSAQIEGEGVSATANRYISTNGLGVLNLVVGNQDVIFPVGNGSYTPVTLKNTGIADNFSVRVSQGISLQNEVSTPLSTGAVNRVWHISEEVSGGSNIQMTLQWNQSDALVNFDLFSTNFVHWNGTKWEVLKNGIASDLGNDLYSFVANNISDFSPFGIVSEIVEVSLPVYLMFFNVKTNGVVAWLDWGVTAKSTDKTYKIQHSLDGLSFNEIGK